jgi:uncharacterized protein (TIGR03437 family)
LLNGASTYDPEFFGLLPSPGSTFSADVAGATDQTVAGTPSLGFELAGISVVVNGVPAAVYAVSPSQVTFQVAWETPPVAPGSGSQIGSPVINTVVVRSGDSNWESAAEIPAVLAINPQAVMLGTDLDGKTKLFAIHQDWHGLVTAKDPAVPGEFVNFYATGIGPPEQPIATGAAGPVPPISAPLPTTGCTWANYTPPFEPLTFPFVGLAPGIVGYYQVALKVPDDFALAILNPQCIGGGYAFGAGFAVKPGG